ncbi:MAG: hypothetical protein H0X46_08110 [Bacteroidetes bacterium]|nr:hypothetical protein [Bacteroidota bacterium]
MNRKLFLAFIIFFSTKLIAQPYADIVNFSYQTFSSEYKDSSNWKNKTDNYFLNFFVPKVFKSGNTFLVRVNSEMLNSTITPDSSYSSSLASISMPIGMKLVSKNKKWETILLAVPKIASDFKDEIDEHDLQYGGIFLQHYIPSDRLKFKAGLYYNREAFGDFFVPLVGVDWKVNSRINMYGILPTNYKVEFNILKDKLYTGLNLKYFTRSFRLSEKNKYDYVRYNEAQVKLFVDYFVVPKVLVFAEVGYSFGENPMQHTYNTDDDNITRVNPVYTPLKNYPVVSAGIAYRIRFDLEKKSEPTSEKQ